MTEAELIQSVLSGRTEDFAPLVRAHEARVRGLCLSILRDPAAAEDAAQESFLKAYRALGRFRLESSFSTWIYRIAHRQCLDALRARRRRAEEPLEALVREPAAPPAPDRELLDALESLSPDHKAVLVLREAQGFTYDEIAAVLEISLDAVKSRLRRAREALRHLIAPPDVQGVEAP